MAFFFVAVIFFQYFISSFNTALHLLTEDISRLEYYRVIEILPDGQIFTLILHEEEEDDHYHHHDHHDHRRHIEAFTSFDRLRLLEEGSESSCLRRLLEEEEVHDDLESLNLDLE